MNSQSPEDQCCAMFTSNTPHFFQIILDDTDLQKLRIPKKFAREYESEISSLVSLKVPSGAVWKVELTKSADGTWLRNGWAGFSKHYSLSYGSFLVFRHEGNGHFHVVVFDRSALEISYPWNGTHGSRGSNGGGFQYHAMANHDVSSSKKTRVRAPSPSPRPHKKMNPTLKDDVSVEFLGETQPSKKARVRSLSPSSRPHKPIISTSTVNISRSALKPSGVKFEIPEPEFNADRPQHTEVCRMKATLTEKEKAEARLLASSFKSENAFFVVVMQPSYITDKLCLPHVFSRRYLPKHNCDVILCNCHQKTWSVRLTPHIRPKFYSGWKKFVNENELEVGDVCVFELINQTKITFNVVIYPRVQDSKTGLEPAKDGDGGKSSTSSRLRNQTPMPDSPSCKRTSTPTKTASGVPQGFSSFKSKNPFFMIPIKPSCVDKVTLPYPFIQKHIKQDVVNLTLPSGDKLWAVRMLTYPEYRYAYLGSGWRSFVRENSVKAGQVCFFELINDGVLRVHIF